CGNPVRGQHLHFLLIAPGYQEDGSLEERVASALKATRQGGRHRSKIFDEVHIDLLTGPNVRWNVVDSRIKKVGARLSERARDGFPNAVVMIYFLGKETVDSQGRRFLWASDTRRVGALGLERAVVLDELIAKDCTPFPGAQVLFLDLGSERPLPMDSLE